MYISNVPGPSSWGVERLILVRMTWLGALDTTHVRALEFATNCVPFLLLNIQMKDVEEENGHCQKKSEQKMLKQNMA